MQEHLLISKATVARLPRYYRCLRQLTDEGVEIASSEELGRRLAINPEQIRKDLAFFGQFGKKGVGYYVAELKESIGTILGLDHHWNVAIIGMGHLGAALANYQGIARLGFRLAAIFDANPIVIGTRVGERRAEGNSEVDFFAYLTNGGFNERFARILFAFGPRPVVIAGPVNHEHFKFFPVQAPDEGTCGNDRRCVFAGAGDGE